MSQVPPPFAPSAPPERKDKSLTIILIVVAVLVCFCACAIGGMYFLGRGALTAVQKLTGPMIGCALNFEATRDGVLAYAKDHGGRLPKAETWQDDVREYVRKALLSKEGEKEVKELFDAKVMDPDKDWACYVTQNRSTGIAFNSDLSGKLLSEIQDPSNTILLFEVEKPAKNAAQKYAPLSKETSPTIMGDPRGWITMPVQGEMRGMEGGNWRTTTRSRPGGDTPSPDEGG